MSKRTKSGQVFGFFTRKRNWDIEFFEKQIETNSSKTLNNFLDEIIKEHGERDYAEEEKTRFKMILREMALTDHAGHFNFALTDMEILDFTSKTLKILRFVFLKKRDFR